MNQPASPVFFHADLSEAKPHPLFPSIEIKDLQPGTSHPAGTFSLMHVKVRSGSRIDAHTHLTETETAYVLLGSARLLCQNVTTGLRPGSGVSIPPGLEHALEADSEVELIAIHTPPLR